MTLQMIRFLMLPRDHYLVLEEALARAFAQLAFVEHLLEDGCHGLKVVGHHHLFEQRAHQARHLLILHDDVVGRLDTNRVEYAERTLGGASATRPREVDALGVTHTRDIQMTR